MGLDHPNEGFLIESIFIIVYSFYKSFFKEKLNIRNIEKLDLQIKNA